MAAATLDHHATALAISTALAPLTAPPNTYGSTGDKQYLIAGRARDSSRGQHDRAALELAVHAISVFVENVVIDQAQFSQRLCTRVADQVGARYDLAGICCQLVTFATVRPGPRLNRCRG